MDDNQFNLNYSALERMCLDEDYVTSRLFGALAVDPKRWLPDLIEQTFDEDLKPTPEEADLAEILPFSRVLKNLAREGFEMVRGDSEKEELLTREFNTSMKLPADLNWPRSKKGHLVLPQDWGIRKNYDYRPGKDENTRSKAMIWQDVFNSEPDVTIHVGNTVLFIEMKVLSGAGYGQLIHQMLGGLFLESMFDVNFRLLALTPKWNVLTPPYLLDKYTVLETDYPDFDDEVTERYNSRNFEDFQIFLNTNHMDGDKRNKPAAEFLERQVLYHKGAFRDLMTDYSDQYGTWHGDAFETWGVEAAEVIQTKTPKKPVTYKNYAGLCDLSELLNKIKAGDKIIVGYSGGEKAILDATTQHLVKRKYKWDSHDATEGKDLTNWLKGDKFAELIRQRSDLNELLTTATKRTVKSKTVWKNYKEKASIGMILNKIDNGEDILIGYSGGVKRLLVDPYERVADFKFKWDDQANSKGTKQSSNWLTGEKFIVTLKQRSDWDQLNKCK